MLLLVMMSYGLTLHSQEHVSYIKITAVQLKQVRLMSNELDYCRDIVDYNAKIIENQQNRINNLLITKDTLKSKVNDFININSLVKEKHETIELGLKKEIKKQKLYKWIAITSSIILGTLLILK